MEAPNPPAAVETFPPAYISRSGPVCGCGSQGFQTPTLGKYITLNRYFSADAVYVSSSSTTGLPILEVQPADFRRLDAPASFSQPTYTGTPGCTVVGTMDAPDLPAAVESFQPATSSRPGPACGSSGRGVQNPLPGKFVIIDSRPTGDSYSASSPSLRNQEPYNRTEPQHIHCYYQNVGGMNTSAVDYLLACSDSPYEIIVLTETWLDNRTCSRQIFGPNYEVFRCDRSIHNSRKSTGGGVSIAVHHQFKASIVENDNWLPVEQVWVTVKLADRRLFLCALYLPPDRIRDPVILNAHMNSVTAIASMASPVDEIIVMGDFNLPGLKWRGRGNGFMYVDSSSSSLSPLTNELLDCYSTATMQQVNNIANENGRFLDLCFASVQVQAPEIAMAPSPLVKDVPHHPPLLVTIRQQIRLDVTSAPPIVYYDFARADFREIQRTLTSINWDAVLDKDDVNSAAMTFSNILNYAIDRHVPKRTMPALKQIPWVNAMLRRLKSERKTALKKFSKYRTLPLRNHYLSINTRYKRLSRSCFRNYLSNIERRLKRNPKSFWKHVNEQRKDNGLPSVMFLGSETASNTEQISQLFARKFSSVFTDERLTREEISAAIQCVPVLSNCLTHLSIDDAMVISAAAKLKSSRSSGPDGIPSVLLKQCINALAAPMSHLNMS
ncbi:uncharacterized protein LOC128732349 [Sabethes cyaneus]|uniref:uncharacterized protein LOC128732349 n=1 Tax=Sabethes cyaneus TaxID=53552 RepID=UPI00237ED874|nr:uncharacterized protein LOC128732349 [Sabethes cyaneus]